MMFSPDVKVRAAAAGNPMMLEYMLNYLRTDPELEVRSWVARNPNCPKEILVKIATFDSNISLRSFANYRLSMIDSKDSAG